MQISFATLHVLASFSVDAKRTRTRWLDLVDLYPGQEVSCFFTNHEFNLLVFPVFADKRK